MQAEITKAAIRDMEKAAAAHLAWLKRVHCALLFGKTAPLDLCPLPDSLAAWAEGRILDKCAPPCERHEALESLRRSHERLRRKVAALTAKASTGGMVGCDDYLRFMAGVEDYTAELRQFEAFLRQSLAETDPLTGVNNRQGMMRDLRREWTRVERTGQPCCLALVDLDHFKIINDTYGHLIGDRVLSAAARFFVRRLRPYDRVYRFGGEEFLFCLPNTDPAKARRVLDRLRHLMARVPVRLEDGRRITVTASIGLAQMLPADNTLEDCVLAADAAVYAAKKQGRNCVMLAADLSAEERKAPGDQTDVAPPPLRPVPSPDQVAKCGSEDRPWPEAGGWAARNRAPSSHANGNGAPDAAPGAKEWVPDGSLHGPAVRTAPHRPG